MIIDATDAIAGRLSTVVAKKAILGEKIDIINSEKALISGPAENTYAAWKQKFDRGIPSKGPFIRRRPDQLLRRIIRGMLPYKQGKGEKAYKNIICHIGVPEEFKGKEAITLKEAHIRRLSIDKYATLEEISKHLGGRT